MRRRKEHLLHTITVQAVGWCFERGVKTLYVGNPLDVTKKEHGRRHNQRMHQWTFGQMFNQLRYKLAAHGIEMVLVGEENTSSTCPSCGAKGTFRGRVFYCPDCGFSCHRDRAKNNVSATGGACRPSSRRLWTRPPGGVSLRCSPARLCKTLLFRRGIGL